MDDVLSDSKTELATFGMGCFWGSETAFEGAPGVISTRVGFMGGATSDPTYRQVCGGRTGHAEVVHVQFDPAVISYEKLLNVFWQNHDPTQSNRQGPDVGAQYRSAIFFYSPEQEATAVASKQSFTQVNGASVATEITPAGPFYEAEEYHQKYHQKQGGGACGV